MKTLRIYFADFWKGFNPENNFITTKVNEGNYIIDENPDFLFYSSQGNKHKNFKNCIKIYFTGENDVPDFNSCDYAISFHPIDFGDRHLRFPLYLLYGDYYERIKETKQILPDLAKRKFCNFVYSNSKLADPFRELFFRELSKYKKIDSGGRLLNNIGGPVADKMSFIQEYKFTIAFENSSVNGYTTEKIIEPMRVNSMPVYWGNPQVDLDFNKESFVWVKEKSKIKEIIDYIVFLDENEEEYLSKLSLPWLTTEQTQKNWDNDFSSFIRNILSQSPQEAKRTSDYGYTKLIRDREISLVKKLFSLFKR